MYKFNLSKNIFNNIRTTHSIKIETQTNDTNYYH